MWIGSFSLHIWQERCRISRVYWCGSIDLTSISLLLKFSINHFQMCRNRSFISIKSMQTIWDYFNGVLCGFFLTMCICGIFTIVFKAVLQTVITAKLGSFIIHYGTKYIQWWHLSNYMTFSLTQTQSKLYELTGQFAQVILVSKSYSKLN